MAKTNHPFYKTSKWRKTRERVMRRNGYLCQESLRYGARRQAEMVHHIYPLEQYPDLAYEQWNLLPLTNKRHNEMHNRVTNELTEKGLYWQEKRKREFERFYAPPHTRESEMTLKDR